MMAMSVGTGDWLLVTSVGMLIVSISVLAWAETAIGRTSRARAAAMVDQLGGPGPSACFDWPRRPSATSTSCCCCC